MLRRCNKLQICLTSKGTENLAGKIDINYNDGEPTTTVTANGTNTVYLVGTITAGNPYYIAVRPEALESGFTIEFLTADKGHYYARSTNNALALARNNVKNLGEFTTGDTDTATKLWGSNWRMPTKDEYEALVANCTKEWKTVNGMQGYMITGKGDYSSNSVFFPAAGTITEMIPGRTKWEQKDEFGKYWSSTPANDFSYVFTFNSSWQYLVTNTDPAQIFSVRAVLAE